MSEFRVLSPEEHAKSKDMWAGSCSRVPTEIISWTLKDGAPVAAMERANISPAMLKCVDEPIVNALDHITRCAKNADGAKVSAIRVEFDRQTGIAKVANDGPGLEIKKHASGKYIPELAFGKMFASTNFSNAAKSTTIGGINGVGVKLTNLHSATFALKTVTAGVSYEQVWTDGMKNVGVPTIKDAPSAPQGTEIAFKLNFAEDFESSADDLAAIIESRAINAAFYMAALWPRVALVYNGAPITAAVDDYISALIGNEKYAPVTWHGENIVISASVGGKTRVCTSIINGIIVPHGNHFSYLEAKFKSAATELIKSRLGTMPESCRFAKLSIVILWRATDLHWSSQTKDKATFDENSLARGLAIDRAFVDSVASRLAAGILDRASAPPRKVKIDIDKYTPAQLAGTKERAKCMLMLAEGDSAMSQVRLGIAKALDFKHYGILSLGGVIPNIRKETRIIGGRVVLSSMLAKNQFMKNIIGVLGLDMSKTYEDAADIRTLNYGGVIACVDQDLDGTGNIFSLVLNLFHVLFPALIRHGYVKRLATPIKRAYPREVRKKGNTVFEFYNEEEYDAWCRKLGEDGVAKYKISYYKGLGSHDESEAVSMFRQIGRRLITYKLDGHAAAAFETYLGADPARRRDVLSKPAPVADEAREQEALTCGTMDASYHFSRDTHQYQLDNLFRKLNDGIGGANQVGCKIINGCLRLFASGNEKKKVASMAGAISMSEHYHHGEASLQDAITRRGFIAIGGNQLPLLVPHGQFGSRNKGGKDAASARYIFATLNTRLTAILYNSLDYPLLSFQYDEGERGEPLHFMPPVPLAITENVSLPAHGWNITVWAREIVDVISNVRGLVRSGGKMPLMPMRPCCYPRGKIAPMRAVAPWSPSREGRTASWRIICDGESEPMNAWTGAVVEYFSGEVWSVGRYCWVDARVLRITELPLCVWTNDYAERLVLAAESGDSVIKAVRCNPDPDRIDIELTLDTTHADYAALASARDERGGDPATDPVIVMLGLRERMADALNFIMYDISGPVPRAYVRTFKSYGEVILAWFPQRLEFYVRRVRRQIALAELWLEFHKNVARFIEENPIDELKAADDVDAWFEENGYAALNVAALRSPELKFREDVKAAVADGASCGYLLDLRARDMMSNAKHVEKISALEAELAELRAPNYHLDVWLRELDELEATVAEGRRTGWRFGDFGAFTFGAAK